MHPFGWYSFTFPQSGPQFAADGFSLLEGRREEAYEKNYRCCSNGSDGLVESIRDPIGH
jgi:hypothetical protein